MKTWVKRSEAQEKNDFFFPFLIAKKERLPFKTTGLNIKHSTSQ